MGKWGCLAFLCLLVLGARLRNSGTGSVRNILHSMFGLFVYLHCRLPCWSGFGRLTMTGPVLFSDRILVLMIIGSIWINDTMAYIVGSLIGKPRSRGSRQRRRWEGTLGGIILAIGVMGLLGWWLRDEPAVALFPTVDWMVVAAIASSPAHLGICWKASSNGWRGSKTAAVSCPDMAASWTGSTHCLSRPPSRGPIWYGSSGVGS